jgi:hypothetical protein
VLADSHQDKAKTYTFPSVSTIAEDALMDERVCRRLLASIERKGVIERVHPEVQYRGITTFYRFPALDKEGGQPVPPSKNDKGDRRGTEGGPKGDESPITNKEEQELEQKQELTPLAGSTEPAGNDSKLEAKKEYVKRIFDYYREKLGKSPAYLLTPQRMSQGTKRLTEAAKMAHALKPGLPLEKLPDAAERLMKYAIDRMAESDWHMGRDPGSNGKSFTDWELLFRSQEKFQYWTEMPCR